MEFRIRSIEDRDFPGVLEIVNAIEAPWLSTEEELRQEDTSVISADGVCRHFVALDEADDTVLGHAVLRGHSPAGEPQSLAVEARVHPEFWGRGIGTSLWRKLDESANPLSPTELTAWVRECYPASIAFAEKAGFNKLRSSSPWYLQTEDADMAELEAAVRNAEELGITITALEDERRSNPGVLSALHRLRQQTDRDIPGMPSDYSLGFDNFVGEMDDPGLLRDGFFIAKAGDDYVGLTSLMTHNADPQALNQTTTGVRSDYRRKGIGLALKASSVLYAKSRGCTSIHTYMDGTNDPMIDLNRKVGFKPGTGVAFMVRSYLQNQ